MTPPRKKPFENILGKRENASKQPLSFSHNVFYPTKGNIHFLSPFEVVVCNCFQFGQG